ncbi:hypothetical protein LCGC14_1563870 [marine sediment metagenome]|uniref:Uncharacterized protein n=1 Tax=marine sediment metagenome TaxID=412755 RepID=A0A0F9L2W7_9ZZZZ
MNCPHCDKPIDEHEAGRETDACVAVVVMGWFWAVDKQTPAPYRRLVDPEIDYSHLPEALQPDDKTLRTLEGHYDYYSTYIADAWEVVNHVWVENESDFFLEYWSDGEWFVATSPLGIYNKNGKRPGASSCDGKKTGKLSAPLAISRAALKATVSDTDK